MRSLSILALLLVAGCGSTPDPGLLPDAGADFAIPCAEQPALCNPRCPPTPPGSRDPCDDVGLLCTYREQSFRCECDHQWHCQESDQCLPPDGGWVCN